MRRLPISSVPPKVACTTSITVSTQPIPVAQFSAMQNSAQIMMALAAFTECFNWATFGFSTG